MESRMEKYYRDNLDGFERSKKNEKLYKDVSREITELDNLPIPDNSNEIDLNGLKQIISSRDEYRKVKDLGRTFVSEKPLYPNEVKEDVKEKDENRIYDINVLLENAKNEINKGNAPEGTKKINANFLTDMEEAEVPSDEKEVPSNNDAYEEAQKVVDKHQDGDINKNSITDSLPLDILTDLKGSDNTVVTDPIVKEEVTMINNIKDGETFYSGSFNFSKKDFDESDDDMFEEKSHTGVKVFFLIFGLLVLAAGIYLIITRYVL